MDSLPLSSDFECRLSAAWPPPRWRDVGVVLAVSGGADSVALAQAICQLKVDGPGRVSVAHFNHQLRGAQSAADQAFVVSLCRQLHIECRLGSAPSQGPAVQGDGLEAAARAARYDFLQATAEALGARYVATAHTADDQAETILHHILRGTGMMGLSGMRSARPLGAAVTLVRPMLGLARADVLAYLALLEQPYREDATNDSRAFTRNRIRHELLPLLKRDYAAGVVESLLRLGALAADAQRVIERATSSLMERAIVTCEPHRVAFDCSLLAAHDRHLVRELLIALWRRQGWPLQAMGFTQWNLLADMAFDPCALAGPPSRQSILPGAIRAQRQGTQLVLQVLRAEER